MSVNESALAGIAPSEKGARALDRIKERFRLATLPAAFHVLAGSENGIHDLYMNLNRQLAEGKLTEKSKLLVAIGAASAVGSPAGVAFFTDCAIAAGLTREEALEAVSIASVCAIFNGYYRFRHQIPAELVATYEAFRAPFNANSFVKGRVAGPDLESICVAVSSINGCHICVEGHVNKAKSLGITDEQIDEIIKAATTAAATANVLNALG